MSTAPISAGLRWPPSLPPAVFGFKPCATITAGSFSAWKPLPATITTDYRDEVEDAAHCVASFRDIYLRKVGSWKQTLARLKHEGRRVTVWGGGSKGVTFLNALGDLVPIEEVVDINPRKQGMYVPGTGQRIVAPEFLRRSRPEVVLVMNPVYREEIADQIAALGVEAEIQTV